MKRLIVHNKKISNFFRCSAESSNQTLVDLILDLRKDMKTDKADRQSDRAADKAERQLERAADKAERQLERAADKAELQQLLDGFKPLWTKAAAHYELSARSYIMNRRKIDDVEAFKCQNLQQLAEICLPASYEFKQQSATKISGIRTSAQMGARATNLAKTALQQISPLREWIKSAKLKIESSKNSGREDHTYLKRKLGILDFHLRAYDALHNNFSSPTSDDAKLQ